jgi:starch synthase
MNIWIPNLGFKGGASVYNIRLASLLLNLGHQVEITEFSNKHQIHPYFLKFKQPVNKPDVIIADVISGSMFKHMGAKLIVIQHHCIFDKAYFPFKSLPQKLVHELLWRRYEKNSLQAADSVVCVSEYTTKSTQSVFGHLPITVIPNAVDTDLFNPKKTKPFNDGSKQKPFRLLYVGNLTRRKGVDLLPSIMTQLGDGFELRYTSGLRTTDELKTIKNAVSLGRLSEAELISEYQNADVFLFPTRFEGFGYAPAEAMSCGTPVVSTNCSSIPEVVVDKESGFLCPVDDVGCFVRSIKKICCDQKLLLKMRERSRKVALSQFSYQEWSIAWGQLLGDMSY